MRKFFNYLTYTSLLVIALSLTACQEEFEEPFEEDSQEIITAKSATASLLKRTVSNDGSFDNIVDGSSCFGISFPYTVDIEGLEIIIDSIEDLKLIEEIFDAVDDDDDILDIIFPITITKADYSEVVINSKEELRELAAECIEGGDDEDIECIDFVYPVKFFTFDANNEVTGEIIINSDKEFRRYFASLGEDGIVSIAFPVTLKKYDGTEIVVNSIAELITVIERVKDECDEDDDDDFNDDDFTKERLDNLLVECPWLVKEVKRNNQDNTEQYIDYVLNFDEDGTVVARDREGNILEGEWHTRVTDFRVKLTLEFEFLVDFSLEWFVYEINNTRIKLFIIGSDGDKIIMKMACNDTDFECPEDFIKENIQNCKWAPSNVLASSILDNLLIDFSNMNILVYNPNGVVVDEGNWRIEGNILIFNDLSGVLENYNGEWKVVRCSREIFKLQRGDRYLIIEKDCDRPDILCPEDFIKNNLQNCKWAPSNVIASSFLDNLLIDFSNMDIHVYNPNGVVVDEGNWEIEGKILIFNDLSGVLANYIGEWEVVRCSPEIFKLQRGDEYLILEKDCDGPDIVCTDAFILDILQDCTWFVSDGNGSSFPNNLEIDFSDMNIHVFNPNGVAVDEGSWEIEGNTLTFDNLTEQFENYTGEWVVIECGPNRFKLKRGSEYLIIEKNCD